MELMEKDTFSAEQNVTGQQSEIVDYPAFDPEEAEKNQKTEAIQMAFWEQKKNFLENVEAAIDSGDLSPQLKDREAELWTTTVKIEDSEYFKKNEAGSADHLTDFMRDLDNGRIRVRHEISLPMDILDNPEHNHMITHELAHGLAGCRQEGDKFITGFNRLFENNNTYLGMCLNEGMTEHIAEKFSGEKINYNADENGLIMGYPTYYKFINFLSSAGNNKIDMKYFEDAYMLSGDEGDKAIATLRDKIAEAFPTENGVHPLDNLAAHNKDQIEYWLATYTKSEVA